METLSLQLSGPLDEHPIGPEGINRILTSVASTILSRINITFWCGEPNRHDTTVETILRQRGRESPPRSEAWSSALTLLDGALSQAALTALLPRRGLQITWRFGYGTGCDGPQLCRLHRLWEKWFRACMPQLDALGILCCVVETYPFCGHHFCIIRGK